MKFAVCLLPAALVLASCGGTTPGPGFGPPGDAQGAADSNFLPPSADVGSVPSDDAGSVPGDDAGTPPDLDGGSVSGCTPTGPEDNDTACQDGIDNDCNGYTDCADHHCTRSPMVTVCGTTGGRDAGTTHRDAGTTHRDAGTTHRDAGTTHRDAGTTHRDSGACTPTVPLHGENTDALCGDGVDNDCNGHVDCNDYSCSRSATVTVCGSAGGRDGGALPDGG